MTRADARVTVEALVDRWGLSSEFHTLPQLVDAILAFVAAQRAEERKVLDAADHLVPRLEGIHYADLVVRRNGKDEHYQADLLLAAIRARREGPGGTL